MTLYIPLRIVNENNLRTHWAVKARRTKEQRMIVTGCLNGLGGISRGALYSAAMRHTLTLTRIAPRMLDGSENLPNAFKATVDAIAKYLGINDRLMLVKYAQRKGKPKEYGIIISTEETA